MAIQEEALSPEAKTVLAIVREEAKEGKLTPKQEELLNKAVVIYEALGLFGKFLLWFMAMAGAFATLWNYFPRKEG